MVELIGALHMHSTFSDGSGKVPEIAGFADEVGLDFIILTDHNTLRALHEGFEKWYGNTLCLVGCEINDRENKNHYLAFGINETFSTRLSAKNYVRKVKEAGGIGFLAHPHEKRNHMKEHPPYPWIEWDTDDFTGIEIWNHMSEWMENLTEQNKYQSFLHPLRTISEPQKETLELWDNLNLKRKVVGIGGVDAHAHKYNLLGFLEVEIFPYKVLFKSIRTHVLVDEPLIKGESEEKISAAKQKIYSALKTGRCFFANDYHADSRRFRFFAESSNETYQMGDTLELDEKSHLIVSIPEKNVKITVIHNGLKLEEFDTNELNLEVKKEGIYRVEVNLYNKAWIYSNHIRIGI